MRKSPWWTLWTFLSNSWVQFLLFFTFYFHKKSTMNALNLLAEAQVKVLLTPTLSLKNFPTSTSPALGQIMFWKTANVDLFVPTHRHVSPSTWAYSPLSWEKCCANCFHQTCLTTRTSLCTVRATITIVPR